MYSQRNKNTMRCRRSVKLSNIKKDCIIFKKLNSLNFAKNLQKRVVIIVSWSLINILRSSWQFTGSVSLIKRDSWIKRENERKKGRKRKREKVSCLKNFLIFRQIFVFHSLFFWFYIETLYCHALLPLSRLSRVSSTLFPDDFQLYVQTTGPTSEKMIFIQRPSFQTLFFHFPLNACVSRLSNRKKILLIALIT